MNRFRLVPVLVLSLASLAAPALAQSGLPLDPELLPPNSAPGDCVVRRVTGPGGAYRWDRVECERASGAYDRWGYGNNRLEIETRGGPFRNSDAGDRYGERRYEYERTRAYGDGYGMGRGGPVVSYPPPYAYGPSYGFVAAGRDEAGYLVWPGKTP